MTSSLNPDAVGYAVGPRAFTYDWRDVVLYALGIGATPADLPYVSELHGPSVYATFAVVPPLQPVQEVLTVSKLGGRLEDVLHRSQSVWIHSALPPSGVVHTHARLSELYDLGAMAQAIVATRTLDDGGMLLFETQWGLLFRSGGGFGGARRAREPARQRPKRKPDFRVEEQIGVNQAALYRLSGDLNPLHIDPVVAKAAGYPEPILHGLCSFGIVGRVLQAQLRDQSITFLTGVFSRPLRPGDRIAVEGWEGEQEWALSLCLADSSGHRALTNCCAKVSTAAATKKAED